MPTTKQSGNMNRENDRKMGSQSSSSSQNDRNKESRSGNGNNSNRQSGNTPRTQNK